MSGSDRTAEVDTGSPAGYRAFGLTILSDFDLPDLPRVSTPARPDIVVRAGRVPPEDFDRADGLRRVAGAAEGVLRARLAEGHEITVERHAEAEPSFLSAVISGELLSVALRQRGHLVLHASAVAFDDVAIGFVGASGWGKSTLAASLIGRGALLLADDVLAVDVSGVGERPLALAAHPSARLAVEAGDGVGVDTRGLPEAHSRTEKRRKEWGERQFAPGPAPLRRLYLLEPRDSPCHEVVPLEGPAALAALLEHTRGRKLLDAPEAHAEHLRQCAAVVRTCGVALLRRRRGLEHLPALRDLVWRDATGGA